MNEQEHLATIATLKAKMHEYHATIGRLMLKWAATETLLYNVLLNYGKLSDAVGRALLSGARAKLLMDYLLAVAENTGLADSCIDDLKCVFAQLTAINTMRDRIVHNGLWAFGSVDGNYAQTITNMQRASRGEANMFMVQIDAVGIDAMVSDLSTIGQHLSRHLQQQFVPYRGKADACTWLYKPPQPILKRAQSHRSDRKQYNQPGSSQA